MNSFDQYMNQYQSKWRHDNIDSQEYGEQHGKKYPWILPRNHWKEGLWPGIRSGSNSLPLYLQNSDVQKHDGVYNLKSSWVQCANLYFSFREDRDIIAGFLHDHVSSQIETVSQVELEWAENFPCDPATLLGEPQGQRGKNQTSPDIAFVVNNGKGIVLVENKFTEHSFYPCSGRKKIYGNPDPQRCMNLHKVYGDVANQCHMLKWADSRRTNRKYWDYIKFTSEGLSILRRCPATNAGYQLFRQQALAEAIAQKGSYEFVISCVAYDIRNNILIECLRSTGVNDFTKGWGSLFTGKAKFTTFSHQQWFQWLKDHDNKNSHKDLLQYIEQRYSF